MKPRDITIVDATGRQAMVIGTGWSWSVLCIDVPDEYQCKAHIIAYPTRTRAIYGAEGHLRWHVIGKPECRECGAWLTRKGATRCRKGTCEVGR